MSCHGSNGGNSKKRIAIISGACVGAAGIVTYVSLANPFGFNSPVSNTCLPSAFDFMTM
ncbi:MAG TPA: hypothetical protein VKA09_02560 [Nitrososphaeraceae archaeon]|jgi:hypothetical protein|nr:hypothetical protein [Nitrososphaeraceae archaeon]